MIGRTLLCLAVALGATGAFADPVADRRAAMDQIRFGAKTLVPMLKKSAEFDAAKAELALRMTYAGALAFKADLFPEGATSKGANPAIWKNLADFDAKRLAFSVDAAKAAKAPPSDLAALEAAYRPLLDHCAACHKPYRIKDK